MGDRLEAHARALRATVLQWTGIPVSVGIAPTKTLAKVANHIAKKDEKHRGACAAAGRSSTRRSPRTPELTDLWGIAGRLAAKLNLLGITTPLDLEATDPLFLRDRLGVVIDAHGDGTARRGVPRSRAPHARPQKHHGLALLRPAD